VSFSCPDRFHATTHRWAAPVVLRAKHCACGKRVTAKQLVQFGSCDSCFTKNKADTSGKLASASINAMNEASQ